MREDGDPGWKAWVVSAAGANVERRFEAPIDVHGLSERPWVMLRPLTAREALRRESLGLTEELEIGPEGTVRSARRSYDLAGMIEFDVQCCVIDYALPVEGADQSVHMVRKCEGPEALGGALLDVLPARLVEWLVYCLDAINLRRPEDAGVLAGAKKA